MNDVRLGGRWDDKGVFLFYLDLATDLFHMLVYLAFFVRQSVGVSAPKIPPLAQNATARPKCHRASALVLWPVVVVSRTLLVHWPVVSLLRATSSARSSTSQVLICAYYGLPLHIMRDLYLTARSFRNRVADFVRYRRIMKNMQAPSVPCPCSVGPCSRPVASHEELSHEELSRVPSVLVSPAPASCTCKAFTHPIRTSRSRLPALSDTAALCLE